MLIHPSNSLLMNILDCLPLLKTRFISNGYTLLYETPTTTITWNLNFISALETLCQPDSQTIRFSDTECYISLFKINTSDISITRTFIWLLPFHFDYFHQSSIILDYSCMDCTLTNTTFSRIDSSAIDRPLCITTSSWTMQ